MSCNTEPFDIPYQDNAVRTFTLKEENGDIVDLTGKTFALKLYEVGGPLIYTLAGTVDEDTNEFTFTLTDAFWQKVKRTYKYYVYIKMTVGGLVESVPNHSIPFNVL